MLSRHENYVTDAEQEREKMDLRIGKLEEEKKTLQDGNARSIQENRYLLSQLEHMNTTASGADAQITTLNATLELTRSELDKLNSLAAQCSLLEAQMTAMELECATLQNDLSVKEHELHNTTLRWKMAQNTITALSEQVECTKQQNKEEQTRHCEVVARLERRNAVRDQLEETKGGAKSHSRGNPDKSVVSNFMRQVLQDNSNLQMGIIELQEMLMLSNQEVESLRDQSSSSSHGDASIELGLKAELIKSQSPEAPFHVHHHYHATPKAENRREKAAAYRRPLRKRYTSSPGMRTPTNGSRTPQIPDSPQLRASQISSTEAILSHTSVSVPPSTVSKRQVKPLQSLQTVFAEHKASIPVSPSSSYEDQSIFDIGDETASFSRPITPASTVVGSADHAYRHHKTGSDASGRSCSSRSLAIPVHNVASVARSTDVREERFADITSFPILDHETIMEEPEEDIQQPVALDSNREDANNQGAAAWAYVKPRLHRANSAESIFLVRNATMPKLRSKPSQLLPTTRGSSGASFASIEPVTSSMAATGSNSRVHRNYDSSQYTRLLLAHGQPEAATAKPRDNKSMIGRKLGGWMVGKWGLTPATSTGDLRNTGINDKSLSKASHSREGNEALKPRHGASQPSQVEAVTIDSALLEDALGPS